MDQYWGLPATPRGGTMVVVRATTPLGRVALLIFVTLDVAAAAWGAILRGNQDPTEVKLFMVFVRVVWPSTSL